LRRTSYWEHSLGESNGGGSQWVVVGRREPASEDRGGEEGAGERERERASGRSGSGAGAGAGAVGAGAV
jgi:hypothetical protein